MPILMKNYTYFRKCVCVYIDMNSHMHVIPCPADAQHTVRCEFSIPAGRRLTGMRAIQNHGRRSAGPARLREAATGYSNGLTNRYSRKHQMTSNAPETSYLDAKLTEQVHLVSPITPYYTPFLFPIVGLLEESLELPRTPPLSKTTTGE